MQALAAALAAAALLAAPAHAFFPLGFGTPLGSQFGVPGIPASYDYIVVCQISSSYHIRAEELTLGRPEAELQVSRLQTVSLPILLFQ